MLENATVAAWIDALTDDQIHVLRTEIGRVEWAATGSAVERDRRMALAVRVALHKLNNEE